jgi:hypothetical protein
LSFDSYGSNIGTFSGFSSSLNIRPIINLLQLLLILCHLEPSSEMAASKFSTTQLFSEEFVESAGTIIFRLSTQEICLVHHREVGEWLLPKGRRNRGESRQCAALREAWEETGYTCRLLPVTMLTRCPPSVEERECPDEPRQYPDAVEPIAVTTRWLGASNVKFIW